MKKNLKISLLFVATALMCLNGSAFGMSYAETIRNRFNKVMTQMGLKQDKKQLLERSILLLKHNLNIRFKGPEAVQLLYDVCGSKEMFAKVLNEQVVTKDNFAFFGFDTCNKIMSIDPDCVSIFKQYITLETLIDKKIGDSLQLNFALFKPSEVACIMNLVTKENFNTINPTVIANVVEWNKDNQEIIGQMISFIAEDYLKNKDYRNVIHSLIRADKTVGKDFMVKVLSWITKENFNTINPHLILDLANFNDKKVLEQIASYISVDHLKDSDYKYIIHTLLLFDPSGGEQRFVTKFSSLINKNNFNEIHPISVSAVIKADKSKEQDVLKEFVSYVDANNFNDITPDVIGTLIGTDTSVDKKHANQIRSLVTKNNFFDIRPDTLEILFDTDKSVEQKFFNDLYSWINRETIQELTPQLYDMLSKKDKDNKMRDLTLEVAGDLPELRNDLLDIYLMGPKKTFIRSRAFKIKGTTEKITVLNMSPSYQHFRTTWEGIYNLFHHHLKNNKGNCLSIFNILKQEGREYADGRYTLCHGRNAGQFVPDLFFMCLQEMFYGKEIDKTCHATHHYAFPGEESELFKTKTINLPEDLVDELVQKGITSSEEYTYERSTMQFASDLFALKRGSSALTYVFENRNVKKERGFVTIEQLFKKLEKALNKDLSGYYTKEEYINAFKEIEELAQKLKHGTMLMYSFTSQALKKYTYATAETGGHKEPIKIGDVETYDTQTVLDGLRNCPEKFDDQTKKYEYVMVLTDKGIANPFNDDIKTYRFAMGDDEKLAKIIEQKILNVCTRIMADMVNDGIIEPIMKRSKL